MTRLVYTTKQALGESAILNTSHPLARGMCLCLPFLEGGGLSRSKDYSGNGWDITAFNGSTWGGPIVDGPAIYQGTAGASQYPATNAVNPTSGGINPIAVGGQMTAAIRCNVKALSGGSDAVMGFGTALAPGVWGLRISTGAATFFRLEYDDAGSAAVVALTPVPTTSLGLWYDLAVTVNVKACIGYCQGVPTASANALVNVLASVSDKFIVGNYWPNLVTNNQQATAYFYVWNRVLSAQELQALHRAPYSMFAQPRRRRAYMIAAAHPFPVSAGIFTWTGQNAVFQPPPPSGRGRSNMTLLRV